ncbi:MAG: hypothetical protein KME08_12755 [Aphanothece sp. CMT-3BRIN-NPC111]|nr:hypothetical protein [Aphanothece sp. CMT-3BRIN-NPC111]
MFITSVPLEFSQFTETTRKCLFWNGTIYSRLSWFNLLTSIYARSLREVNANTQASPKALLMYFLYYDPTRSSVVPKGTHPL